MQLLVSGKLNYELKSQHDIAVSVNDSGGKIHVTSFTIGVQDINDAPTVTAYSVLHDDCTVVTRCGCPWQDLQLAGGHPVVTENRQAAVIGELVTTDEDRNQKFTYFLVSDGGGPFVIVNREVRLKNRSSVDYETNTRFTIRVISKDNGSPPRSFEKTITVQVIDVNEAPTSVSLSTYKVIIQCNCYALTMSTCAIDHPCSRKISRSRTINLSTDAWFGSTIAQRRRWIVCSCNCRPNTVVL